MLAKTEGSGKELVVGRLDKELALFHQLLAVLLGLLEFHKLRPIRQLRNHLPNLERQSRLDLLQILDHKVPFHLLGWHKRR